MRTLTNLFGQLMQQLHLKTHFLRTIIVSLLLDFLTTLHYLLITQFLFMSPNPKRKIVQIADLIWPKEKDSVAKIRFSIQLLKNLFKIFFCKFHLKTRCFLLQSLEVENFLIPHSRVLLKHFFTNSNYKWIT